MHNLIIIDGYNIINSWKELKNLCKSSIERARDRLVYYLVKYKDSEDLEIFVVFDGGDDVVSENMVNGIKVIYTGNRQSADSLIESIVDKDRNKYKNITVVTSDSNQQFAVFGMGALRVSSKEFEKDVISSFKKFDNMMNEKNIKSEIPFRLKDRFSEKVLKKIKDCGK